MQVYQFEPGICLIDVALPIPGFEGILGAYVIKSDKVALIDVGPASSLGILFSALEGLEIKPQDVDYILSTHVHLDHLGGIGQALKRMPKAKCIVHQRGKQHLIDPAKLWEGSQAILGQIAFDYGKPEPVDENRLISAREGMVVSLGGIQLEVLETPGHASHHLSFFDRQRGKLFPGEAAGVYFPETDILRPASPPPFDLRQTLASLNKLITAHPREIYYSHFGYSPDAMTRLLKYKEQLVLWARIIARNIDIEPQKIIEGLLIADKTQERVYGFTPERLRTDLYFINNSIRGFLDYFKREGTGILESAG
jgi:glyoxylase-like metal-dependent hydrolase (beta-lactamase superfamily II)